MRIPDSSGSVLHALIWIYCTLSRLCWRGWLTAFVLNLAPKYRNELVFNSCNCCSIVWIMWWVMLPKKKKVNKENWIIRTLEKNSMWYTWLITYIISILLPFPVFILFSILYKSHQVNIAYSHRYIYHTTNMLFY